MILDTWRRRGAGIGIARKAITAAVFVFVLLRFLTFVCATILAVPVLWGPVQCAAQSSAQAASARHANSLRNPQAAVARFFPDSDGVHEISSVLSKTERAAVEAKLPFEPRHGEFSVYRLYIATRKGEELGYLHVGEERGRWGLTEIAWAFDTSMRAKGFLFQRCREKSRTQLETADFTAQFQGRNASQLRRYLAHDGTSLDRSRIRVPDGAENLALTVLKSALKSAALLSVVRARHSTAATH